MEGLEESGGSYSVMYFVTFVLSITVFVFVWLFRHTRNDAASANLRKGETGAAHSKSAKLNKGKAKHSSSKNWKKSAHHAAASVFSHPELVTNFKGHTAPLTSGDISSNGKYFISAAEDRCVMIWNLKELTKSDHKGSRGNIEFDHARFICWSPDSKAFIIHKAAENTIEVYKVSKKSDRTMGNFQLALTFPQHDAVAEVLTLAIAINGRFIMTCNSKNQLILWDLKGEILACIDTKHGNLYSATLSPCGRFIATTGFTPDVKVWEVILNKSGTYEGLKRAFDLTGHTSGIYDCSFNCDSSKMVSISKDRTWRLYDTRIEYSKGQDPYFLFSGNYDRKPDIKPKIRLSPDGRTIAVVSGPDLIFCSAITGEQLHEISDIYSGAIVEAKFDPSSKYIFTLGDRHIRVFHNLAGYTAAIQELESSLSKASTAGMRERIRDQLKEARTSLEKIQKNAT